MAEEKKLKKKTTASTKTAKTAANLKKTKKIGPKTEEKSHYFEGIGRRKTAVARVRIEEAKSPEPIMVNNKTLEEYFSLERLKEAARAPLSKLKLEGRFRVSVRVKGSGIKAQAEAIRHGLARAIAAWDENFKKKLRRFGFLTRDPRMVERKKYGLKKARRAPQWAKR